jgi:hypothetical protein
LRRPGKSPYEFDGRHVVADNTQSTEVPDSAIHPAAKVIAQALRHRGEQIERGTMGDRQTETPNQIAERALAAALPVLRKQGAEEERERLAIPEAKLLAALEAVRREVRGWADRAERDGNNREAETLDAAVEAFALDTPERILAAFEEALKRGADQERQRLKEALGPIKQILDLEIERCQELGDVWDTEADQIDVATPVDPRDRARFFYGQREKLKEVRASLAVLDTLEADRG